MRYLLLFCFALSSLAILAQDYKPVEVNSSEQRTIYSNVVNQEYTLHILNGSDARKGEKLPVLYLLDSQWDFPLMNSIYGEQYYDGYTPKMLIVGVTWGKSDNPDILRRRDYTPTPENGNGNGGGADKFLEFFETELFPFIEKEYNGDSNNRTIAGCSLGGLFTLYALFHKAELFDNYIAASPAIGWDRNYLFEVEEAYSKNNSGKIKNVFMGHGSEEFNGEKFELFLNKIASRDYNHLNVRAQFLEGVGHSGTKALAYTWGTQHVYKKPVYNLSLKDIKTYVGKYKNDNGNIVELTLNSGSLFFTRGNFSLPLRPATKDFFVYDGMFLNVSVQFDDNGNIKGITQHNYGNDMLYTKL